MTHDPRLRSRAPRVRGLGALGRRWLARTAWLAGTYGSLASCAAPSKQNELPAPDLAGSESGNPPIADHETCRHQDACAGNAQRFVDALSQPLTLAPLEGSCVDDVAGAYCECAPIDDPWPAFTWPQHFAFYGARSDGGCALWTRLASVLPALRSDPAQCLFRDPPPLACAPEACRALCQDVQAARAADASHRYDARLRFARCGHVDNACVLVFELDGRCYAKSGEHGVESSGPFDCGLSDSAILDRAFPGWEGPAICGPDADC